MATTTDQMASNSNLPSNGYLDLKSPVSSITEIPSPCPSPDPISTETQNTQPHSVVTVIETTETSPESTRENGVEVGEVKADEGESLESPTEPTATSTTAPENLPKTPAISDETSPTSGEAVASDEISSTLSEAVASSNKIPASSNKTPASSSPISEVGSPDEKPATSAEEVSTPPPPKTASEKSNMILDILERYRMSNAKGTCKVWSGRNKVFDRVTQHIESQTVIRMILPAFPFKSPNKGGKVLGDLPDTAEEIALKHLHGLCTMIGEVHAPGAQLYIVSDGLMYNGKLHSS
jgi:Pyoverdine/dityrosine biosynthesis protein